MKLIMALLFIFGLSTNAHGQSVAKIESIHARAKGSCEQRYKKYSMSYNTCVSERSNPINTCVASVRAAVDSEDAPAAIEACESAVGREHVRECNDDAQCIIDETIG